MSKSDADVVSYLVVVRGLHESAQRQFFEKFPKHRGGATPGPDPREIYLVVDCEPDEVSANLCWIAEAIPRKYRAVELGVHIYTPRNWANFDVPAELLGAAHQYGATLRVSFMSPAI
ncbi:MULTISPECIES: hypothetical protein [unclassified Variovorax]|uniref:hypothetical protein n=1 Tax=unclassified Variovorax TaxID=663243 RepID=UPI003F48A836